MKYFLTILLLGTFLTSFSQTYFIVRHAERESDQSNESMMKKNPPDRGKNWTKQDLQKLEDLAEKNTPTRVIGLKLGRTRGRCSNERV